MATRTTSTSLLAASAAGILALGLGLGRTLLAPAPATPPLCPEVVVRSGAHREPRNAAGQVRYCWPGMAKCVCDSDGDCYADDGYVACTPRTSAMASDGGVIPRDASVARDAAVPARDAGPATLDIPVAPPLPIDAGVVAIPTPTGGDLVAFPGAEGFGARATGGRGGRVIYVTNLNTSGPGSLQDALLQTGPRYVLFKVSGLINGDVRIGSGNVTIAGQTSPGGITVRGIDTTEEPYCDQSCGARAKGVENFVVRHLRSRPAGGAFPDGLRLRYARNGIVDHLSMGNAEDEAVELSYASNITVQDCILAETLGDHAIYGGMLINYTNPAAGYALDGLTIVRNVWNRIQGRYPEFSRESGAAAGRTTMRVELTNNLLWDQRYFIDVNPTNVSGGNAGTVIHYQINWIGNVSYAPATNAYGMIWLQNLGGGTTTSAYFADNRAMRWPSRSDWDLNYCCNDYRGEAGSRPAWARSARFPFPQVTVLPSSAVRAYAAANAGAFPRDPMDTRLMGFVSAGQIDGRRSNANPAGDALRTLYPGTGPAAPADTDGDGMPDAWEVVHGLDPLVAGANSTTLQPHGYPDLEVYLHELSVLRVSENR